MSKLTGPAADLIRHAVARLTEHGVTPEGVSQVLAALPYRVVFETRVAGRDCIVKVHRSKDGSSSEVAGMELARSSGARVPPVRYWEPGPPVIVVQDRVAGRPLAYAEEPEAWRDAGRQLAAMHAATTPAEFPRFDQGEAGWRQFIQTWVAEEVAEARREQRLDEGSLTALETFVDEAFAAMGDRPRTMLHGDCQAEHLLVDDRLRVVAVLDFGDTGTGDPLWDIATICLWNPERLPALLEGYGRPEGLTPAEGVILQAYSVLRHLTSASWLAANGFDPSPDLASLRRMATLV